MQLSGTRISWCARIGFLCALVLSLTLPAQGFGASELGHPAPGLDGSDLEASAGTPVKPLVTGLPAVAAEANDDVPGLPLPASPFTGYLSAITDTDDVFFVDLDQYEWLTVELYGPAKSSFYLYFWSPDTKSVDPADPEYDESYLLDRSEWGYPEMVQFRAPVAGRYYVNVFAQAGLGNYELSHMRSSGNADDDIPGVPLPASPVKGDMSDTDVSDVYSVELEEGQTLRLSVSGSGSGWAEYMLLVFTDDAVTTMGETPARYWWDPMFSSELESELSILVPPGGGGTYYVEVFGWGDSGYTLDWSVSKLKAPRVAGKNRYLTSYAISGASFRKSDHAVIATGRNFPDALAASGLAGVLDCPVLLAPRFDVGSMGVDDSWYIDEISIGQLMSELEALQVKKVYIVGGTGAVSEDLVNQIIYLVEDCERVAGVDRYDTARAVADKMVELGANPDTAFLATGAEFADALAASPFAFGQKIPILLTRADSLPDCTRGFIQANGIEHVVTVGGPAAVSETVLSRVEGIAPGKIQVERLGGTNRFSTANKVARYCVDDMAWGSWECAGIATGANFPDALSGGPACGVRGGPMLLTNRMSLAAASESLLTENAATLDQVLVFGGTGVLDDAVRSAVVGAIE